MLVHTYVHRLNNGIRLLPGEGELVFKGDSTLHVQTNEQDPK